MEDPPSARYITPCPMATYSISAPIWCKETMVLLLTGYPILGQKDKENQKHIPHFGAYF